jgi:hypothetical protein
MDGGLALGKRQLGLWAVACRQRMGMAENVRAVNM